MVVQLFPNTRQTRREVCVWRVDLVGEGREIKQGSARWEYNV